ncbi:MAG: RluA family pseudouridine synthase [Clostridia bacterium]|nr:RluA family pseudouridine synthase [Clostridia bacterium]
MIEILYEDSDIVACVKPVGMSSEGDLPKTLGEQINGEIFTLHRLDTPVGGVMVYAKNKKSAAVFSKKIAEKNDFTKTYFAVCEGSFNEKKGEMCDLLFKDSAKNKSYVVKRERKGVKKAELFYNVIDEREIDGKKCSLVSVTLKTGRSHQIRVQFASRKHPLLGDKKYGSVFKSPIALFSQKIETDNKIFEKNPPKDFPWDVFDIESK